MKPLAAKRGSQGGDTSGSDSDDTDSDSEDDTPPEPSPLPPSRPQDIEGGIKYDTVKIVWSPRNRHPSPQNVRNAMVQFSELVKGVRDTWKARSEALKAAENQNLEDKIPAIKKDVILQRRLLDLIVNTSLEQGHPVSIRRYVLALFSLPPILALLSTLVEARVNIQRHYYVAMSMGVNFPSMQLLPNF